MLSNHFVKSKSVLDLIAQSKIYGRTPAELLFIEDEYTAFCLNQACAYIRCKIEEKEEPIFETKYNSFSQMYAQYDD